MPEPAVLTAAEIARLAGVTRATVSNWRRRHPDFPEPSGGTGASPAYDRAEVEAWLAARDALPELPPEERLWQAILDAAGGGDLGEAVDSAALALQGGTGQLAGGRKSGAATGQEAGPPTQIARELAATEERYGRHETLAMLVGKYADAAGTSVTPRPVAGLMAALADADHGVVLDPAAGTGELLAAALEQDAARVAGQELDDALARLAEIRLRMAARQHAVEIRAGDSFASDAYPALLADAVLCHPPFASRDWHQEELAADTRWEYGIPPKSESELAWAQHALAHLRPGGRAVLLFPPAVASRPSGRRIRAGMLRDGALRAIVSLPAGVVRPSHLPLHVWVLERPHGEAPPDPRVLLADAAALPAAKEAGTARAPVSWQQMLDVVVAAWRSFSTDSTADSSDPRVWRSVRAIDLLDDAVDLTPARHVGAGDSGMPPAETAETVKILRGRVRAALAALEPAIPGGGWGPRDQISGWRTMTVADLARSGMAVLHRAPLPAPADADLHADGHEHPAGSCPVLTVTDVIAGSPPRAAVDRDVVKPDWIVIRPGDVIVPAGRDAAARGMVATDGHDSVLLGENLHLIRPDQFRIDPWFLCGFLSARASIRQASYGTTTIRIDARRLAVPLLPMAEQRRYGEAFRQLRDFGAALRELSRLAGELTGLLDASLAESTLIPAKQHEPGISSERS
jgi:hypothetical protein